MDPFHILLAIGKVKLTNVPLKGAMLLFYNTASECVISGILKMSKYLLKREDCAFISQDALLF
ncbi:hypothetical protein Golomagni_04044 [Golovinomyces magnicellulatus]|nr:hypothetical protein Golomagni_04044 [Golovinomyces magnicellulatus]